MTAAKADRFSSKACQEAKPWVYQNISKQWWLLVEVSASQNSLGEVYIIYHMLHLPLFCQFLERVRLQKSTQKFSTNVEESVNGMKYKIYDLHSICIHLLHKVWSSYKFFVSQQISWFHEAAFLSSESFLNLRMLPQISFQNINEWTAPGGHGGEISHPNLLRFRVSLPRNSALVAERHVAFILSMKLQWVHPNPWEKSVRMEVQINALLGPYFWGWHWGGPLRLSWHVVPNFSLPSTENSWTTKCTPPQN